MNQKFTFRLVMCLIACALCASSSVCANVGSFKNIAFESVGYDTSTYIQGKNVALNFSSPYEEASGELDLHIIVIDDGIIEPKINNATILSKYFNAGENLVTIAIPTGLIDLGNNTIPIFFIADDDRYPDPDVCKITLLEDSAINITSAI